MPSSGSSLPVHGSSPRKGGAPASEDRTAEQVYKNIKALQGTPASELNQSMHLMKGAVEDNVAIDDSKFAKPAAR